MNPYFIAQKVTLLYKGGLNARAFAGVDISTQFCELPQNYNQLKLYVISTTRQTLLTSNKCRNRSIRILLLAIMKLRLIQLIPYLSMLNYFIKL